MKKMLIAASAVGATIAGLILYWRNRTTASEAGQIGSKVLPHQDQDVRGNIQHAMG